MWKLVIFPLFLIVGVKSDCSCYQASQYTGKLAVLSNAYDSSDFSACYSAPCSFVAYTGLDTYGWTNLVIQWSNVSGTGGMLQIFDGPTDSGTALIQVKQGENVATGDPNNLIKSSSPYITIKYSQSGTSANVYYGTISSASGLQPAQTTTTSTASPTTRSYSSSIFNKDPYLITHDIVIAINQKSSGGIAALNNINALAYNFVNQLSITTDSNSASGTRLSLATLTPYTPFYSVQGDLWSLTASTFLSSLPKNGFSLEVNIDQALAALVNLTFTVNTNSSTDSRPNVQRTIVLFTAEWPSTGADLNETVKLIFDAFGANLLVVGYNLSDTERSLVMKPNRWYNVLNSVGTKDSAVADFVNPYFFNNGSSLNYWCPKLSINTTGAYSYFNEPAVYFGADGLTDSTRDWSELQPFYGQSGRYCNFANNEYSYQKPDGVMSIKVTVYYELEAGRDTLNFYDSSNNLIASFTGFDISEGSFYTSTSTLKAIFTSDNKSVYRGFFVKIEPLTS